jgi:small subunit ribosomal protein S4
MPPQKRQKQKSEYGIQFQEKQKMKQSYGLREKQFRSYFKRAGNPEGIIQLLELRLDNIVYRSGLTQTRRAARQLVSHGHIQVNQKNVNLPSFRAKAGDVITIHPLSKDIGPFQDLALTLKKFEAPTWIGLDKSTFQVTINSLPVVEDPMIVASVKPIIEFYSR